MKVRGAIAVNQHTPQSLIERLALDPDEFVRIAVLCNPQCPAAILESFAEHPSIPVREFVAQHSNASAWLAFKIWQNAPENENLIDPVLSKFNNLLPEQLTELAEYTFTNIPRVISDRKLDEQFRFYCYFLNGLASCPHSPIWIWEKFLANEPKELYNREPGGREYFSALRKRLAKNPSIPTSMLEKIVTEADSGQNEVRRIAIAALRHRN